MAVLKKIYSKEQFFEAFESNDLAIELKKDKKISDKIMNKGKGGILGFCQVCKFPTLFFIDTCHSDNGIVNFRERMVCPICNLNNRQRFLFSEVIKKAKYYKNCQIYIYEQVTQFYKKLKRIYPNIIGSEYLGSKYNSGMVVNGIRHEDSTKLSFSDELFDLVLSFDVFEHVFDLEQSFNESYRILKPKGRIIFTIPFYAERNATVKRAEIVNGDIVLFKEAQYHGNPISEKGSLVVYDISWDIFDFLKKCGFSEIYIISGYNRFNGNIGTLLTYFEAIKS